jgi:fibronectin type 3 domain-containing protein
MKKMRTVLFTAAAAVLFVLFSCDNQFLSEPYFPSGGGAAGRGISAPEGVKASQGERRKVTLSWNPAPNAVRYYIYRANNLLETFNRCGETNSTQFEDKVEAGSKFYYRISSVSNDGAESVQSFYVGGTSLAQPLISDITDITEEEAAVTWYMDNVSDDSYKDKLLYTVYCFNGTAEVAQIALDGSMILENKAVFKGLAPNTSYEYQVEAYLRGDQSASEKSIKMNAATARRFRPGAPRKLKASRGAAKDKVTLSFDLPDMVDIALGDNLYEPKPLYFVIKKRFYSESGNNEYETVCAYFGSTAGKGTPFPNGISYIPGAAVTWIDQNVQRGVKYEYLVQSYVDETLKTISSDASIANADGWALSEGSLSFGEIKYTEDTDDDLYTSAELPLVFEFDPQDEEYEYELVEKIEPLGDTDPLDPAGGITNTIPFVTSPGVNRKIVNREMDLTQKPTQDNPGRGLYSYAVEIRRDGVVLDTISTIGKKEVSENTDPIIVENFRVQDGYTNKFVLKWDSKPNRKYTLNIVDAKGVFVKEIASDAVPDASGSYTYSATDILPGVMCYFAIRPSKVLADGTLKYGQMVYAPTASQTLGVPKLSLGGGASYSAITAEWTEAQKADTYRIKYRYAGETNYITAETVKKEKLDKIASGNFKYTFKPEGTEIDIAKAGKEIQIEVDALNEGLRAEVGGGEIVTSSVQNVSARLVGPAELGLSAGRGASAQEIAVSWNKISGADGYYVFRREFNMNNTAEAGSEPVVYYVSADGNSVIGKDMVLDSTNNNAKIDASTVKAAVTFTGSRYTLKDMYMADVEYDSNVFSRHTDAYRNQQNDMAQGYPYRYWVVPAISSSTLNSIVFAYNKDSGNKNTDIAHYTIQENSAAIKYSGAGAIEKNNGTGFAIGFGQDVTATKGTYASSGNVNDKIKITWETPPLLSGSNITYTVYRRTSGGSWETVVSNISALEYIDTPSVRGIAYEYVIGITNSDPRTSRRFIDLCYTRRDERDRPLMLGFMLDNVKMESVSRNEQKVGNDFAEEVKWYSAGVKNSFNADNNWGIDGYEVYVMNQNIDANWHLIADIPSANIFNQINQSVKVTNVKSGNTLEGGLLKVMRDYKHFFMVRSYVLNAVGEKVLCPNPNWTYEYKFGTTEAAHIAASNNMQNDYVKWGARQITKDEFIQIVSVYAGRGINDTGGGAADKTINASTTWGGSGSVTQDYTYQAATDAHKNYKYNNYKTDLYTRGKQWVTFITINGNIWSRCYPIGSWPFRYGEDGWVTIKGPWDTPDLYTGQIIFGRNKSLTGATNGGFSWNGNGTTSGGMSTSESGAVSARIAVKYPGTVANPGAADEEQFLYRGRDTALQFKDQGSERYNQDAWK